MLEITFTTCCGETAFDDTWSVHVAAEFPLPRFFLDRWMAMDGLVLKVLRLSDSMRKNSGGII